jgi:hypothetical protein
VWLDAAGGDGRKVGAGGQDPYHIAFGTKVSSSRKSSSKESSGRKSEQSKPTTSRSEKVREINDNRIVLLH